MRKIFLVLSVFVFLAGCATGKIQNVQLLSPAEKIQLKDLRVQIDPGPASLEQAEDFRKVIVEELAKSGFGVSVDSENLLMVKIKSIRAVPISKRVILGTLAGKSSIKAEVTLNSSEKKIVNFLVIGKSGPGFFPDPGAISSAYKKAAQEIVKQLQEHI